MRYDFAAYQMTTISRDAVRLCADRVVELLSNPEVPDELGRRADLELRAALARYTHISTCVNQECGVGRARPSQSMLVDWAGRLAHRSPFEVASEILSYHPTVSGFAAVLALFDQAGGEFENVLEVLGDEAPGLLADFSPGMPLVGGMSAVTVGTWFYGARGFG